MSTPRLSLLTAIAVAACAPPAAEPRLSLRSDVSSFDGRTEHAVLTVEATTAAGTPGEGTVVLVAPAGSFVGGAELTLADGLATATYLCDPHEEPACNGALLLGASWSGLNATVQVRVTPATAVTAVTWRAVPTRTLSELTAMAVSASGRLWAVGTTGAVLALTGATWSSVPSGSFADLLGVAFTPSGQGVVVGRQGTLLVEGAQGLAPVATGLTVDLTAVYARSATEVVVGASDGTLSLFDGARLTAQGTLGTSVLTLVGRGDEVWAGGDGAAAVLRSGTWTTAALPVQARMQLSASSPEGLWLGGPRAGGAGSVLLLGPGDWRTFDVAETLTAIAVVPESVERFVISERAVYRQAGLGAAWTSVETPMGGRAAASRGVNDLVIVGPPGMSLLRD